MSEIGRMIMGRRIPVTTGLLTFSDQNMAGVLRSVILERA